jgi:hypothetical protein
MIMSDGLAVDVQSPPDRPSRKAIGPTPMKPALELEGFS